MSNDTGRRMSYTVSGVFVPLNLIIFVLFYRERFSHDDSKLRESAIIRPWKT